MQTPKITVYIASHNYGRFLEAAVESVLRQSVDNWELLIINDNSDDDTADVMKLYEGDSRIRFFTTDGIGLPGVCNLALREARGEMVIRLDGDDILDEHILLVLSNYLDRYPNCAMVFPDYYLMDEYGRVFAQERREKLHGNNHLLDVPANGACSLIRKQVLEELGGYREDLGAQDGYDIWNRLLESYRVANVSLPLFYYRRHGKNLTENEKNIFQARRGIKFDAIREKLARFRPIIALIPCRVRYDFSPNLWKREVNGKSLLERSITRCVKSSLFDHIVVAADTLQVQTIIGRFDDKRLCFFERRSEDTIRSATLVPTLEGMTRELDPDCTGLTVLSYLQAPFVQTETLEEAVTTLLINDVSSSMGVAEVRDRLFKRSPHGLQPLNPSRGIVTDFDAVYREANTSLALRNRNIKSGSMMGPQVVHFVVSEEEHFFINSEQTLKIAEILLNGEAR